MTTDAAKEIPVNKCAICKIEIANTQTTCGTECQATLECTNQECPCQVTNCINCGEEMPRGFILCSTICEAEVDQKVKSFEELTALTRPHFPVTS